MTEPTKSHQTLKSVEARMPEVASLPSPEGANWFHIATTGMDFQLLVGYLDINELVEKSRSAASSIVVTPQVTHRYSLSLNGFQALRQQVEEIAKAIGLPSISKVP